MTPGLARVQGNVEAPTLRFFPIGFEWEANGHPNRYRERPGITGPVGTGDSKWDFHCGRHQFKQYVSQEGGGE